MKLFPMIQSPLGFLFCAFLLCFSVASLQVSGQTSTIASTIQSTPSLSSLSTLLTDPFYSNIVNALNGPGQFTLFAPNNDAFSVFVAPSEKSAIADTLLYHALNGSFPSYKLSPIQFVSTLYQNSKSFSPSLGIASANNAVTLTYGIQSLIHGPAKVVVANVFCSNGVIHIIDVVMGLPETTTASAFLNPTSTRVFPAAAIVSSIDTVYDLQTPLTVFVPTDAAFNAIHSVLRGLTIEQIQTVLEYHVVTGAAFSNQLQNGQTLVNFDNENLVVQFNGNNVTIVGQVNKANVILPNLITQNGVNHIIDTVLIPPQLNKEIKRRFPTERA